MAMTPTERKQKERAIRKAGGFVERTFWIRPEWFSRIEKLLRRLGR